MTLLLAMRRERFLECMIPLPPCNIGRTAQALHVFVEGSLLPHKIGKPRTLYIISSPRASHKAFGTPYLETRLEDTELNL